MRTSRVKELTWEERGLVDSPFDSIKTEKGNEIKGFPFGQYFKFCETDES